MPEGEDVGDDNIRIKLGRSDLWGALLFIFQLMDERRNHLSFSSGVIPFEVEVKEVYWGRAREIDNKL